MADHSGDSEKLMEVYVVNDLMGEGQNHVLARRDVPLNCSEKDKFWFGDPGVNSGIPYPVNGGTHVGSKVYLVTLCDRGCCYGVLGVHTSRAQAAAEAAAADDGFVQEVLVEG